MSWYRAVARPLLFSLPPEASHRVAGELLQLPLPWARLGRASADPALRRNVAGLELRNPVGLAAGFDKTCAHLDALGALGFGYVVGGTLTTEARQGNPKPRIVRYRGRSSMTNAMGLPNPGVETVARALQRRAGSRRPAPQLVSLADEEADDVRRSLDRLLPLVDGFELNVSCPNVSWGRDVDVETHLHRLLTSLGERDGRPLFVKLPPFRTQPERDAVMAMASLAAEDRADGITASNTRPVADPALFTGRGGISGRALLEGTVRNVAELRQELGAEMPINACGGVFRAGDAISCLEAGATTVQIYTGLIYEGPGVVGSLTRGIAAELRHRAGDLAAA
jgi:dihydroorotate dehydrogenase